jgi:cytochrome P450
MQIRILIAQLLSRYRIELEEGSGKDWQAWPIPRPKDGLPLRMVPLG